MSDPLTIGFDVSFDEAISAAGIRGVVLPEIYYQELKGIARQLAFSVAGQASLDELQAVKDSLDKAMNEGLSFGEWKVLAAAMDLGLPEYRLDNIFRTNLQGNYMRGKWQQFTDNAENRPYLMYDAINDSRVRPAHLAMDGTIRRIGDPWFDSHSPPNGFRCVMPWTKVRGDFEIGLKSRYSGDAVEIKTKSGSVFSVTANHPVLSDNGWIPAHQIKQGNNVFHHNIISDVDSTGIVDNNNPPSCAENVFNSLAFQAFGFIDISSFEFHGDAKCREGKVYVAGTDCTLMNGFKPSPIERIHQRIFVRGYDRGAQGIGYTGRTHFSNLPILTIFAQYALDVWPTALLFIHKLKRTFSACTSFQHPTLSVIIHGIGFFPSSAALAFSSSGGVFNGYPLKFFGFALRPSDCSGIPETSSDCSPAGTKVFGKFKFTASKFVGLGDGLLVKFNSWLSRVFRHDGIHFGLGSFFDTSIPKHPIEQTPADPLSFKHFHDRFSRQVFIDEVVSVRNFSFIGHVYDFQCKNGIIVTDGIITHNCRCSLISLNESGAQKRSGQGAGLNKIPMVKGADGMFYPAEPDKGWAYNPFQEMKKIEVTPDHAVPRTPEARVYYDSLAKIEFDRRLGRWAKHLNADESVMRETMRNNAQGVADRSEVYLRANRDSLDRMLKSGAADSHTGEIATQEWQGWADRYQEKFVDYALNAKSNPPIIGYLSESDDLALGNYSLDKSGDIAIKLKSTVRDRTTAMYSDTTAVISDTSPVVIPRPLNAMDEGTIHVYSYGKSQRPDSIADTANQVHFWQAHVFDGVKIDDIDYIVFPIDPPKVLQKQLQKAGIEWRTGNRIEVELNDILEF